MVDNLMKTTQPVMAQPTFHMPIQSFFHHTVPNNICIFCLIISKRSCKQNVSIISTWVKIMMLKKKKKKTQTILRTQVETAQRVKSF